MGLRQSGQVPDDSLVKVFDSDPLRYDRARPRYPAALVDELLSLASVAAGGTVLEIAPGTGQLSLGLASRRVRLTAVELGPGLAAVLRDNLAPWPDAVVVNARFETWSPPEAYDLVVCATAWHWLDPSIRIKRALAALRPGGALAVISTHHVQGGTKQFFVDAQECYLRSGWESESGFVLPEDVTPDTELDESGRFASVLHREHRMDVTYTAAEHVEVLRTYSPTARLSPEQREDLMSCLTSLMNDRYGGSITVTYAFELTVARLAEAS
jgi:SAM-dependent methyltransferase